MTMPSSRYGGGPGAGLTIPPYFKPTPSVRSRNNYFPISEKLGPDEMRISFMGSTPFPPRIDQAGTCIMVELGNGDSFFFDFGPGCLRNIIAMGHSQQLVQDIFITHLHVDHGQDFSTWSYETERPMSLELLSNMVKRKLPANIYRCKGVVYAAEAAERRAILQVVGRRTDVALEDEWGERSPGTRIVAIGAPGSIDHDELTALFDSCVVEPATARR